MSIVFDIAPIPRTRRAASLPSSLLNRIEKAPLLDRLSRDDVNAAPTFVLPFSPKYTTTTDLWSRIVEEA